MILYVDETENDEYFIVAGLLANSREDVSLAYKRFNNTAHKSRISKQYRTSLFQEFKSTLMDRNFQNLKVHMLEEINKIEHCVIFSCHIKKSTAFVQKLKEVTYITLLSRIVSSIDSDISIIFDAFGKKDFEEKIIDIISEYPHVQAIMPRDSQKEEGLQFVDNLCSVVRHHKSGTDANHLYELIENNVKEI